MGGGRGGGGESFDTNSRGSQGFLPRPLAICWLRADRGSAKGAEGFVGLVGLRE